MVSCLSLPPLREGTGRLETVVIGRVGLAPFEEGTGRLETAVVGCITALPAEEIGGLDSMMPVAASTPTRVSCCRQYKTSRDYR